MRQSTTPTLGGTRLRSRQIQSDGGASNAEQGSRSHPRLLGHQILATTLGETGGDTVTMTMDLGYLTGTAIFLSTLIVLVGIQIAAKKFYPALYWSVIVASTTAGTTMADFATRSLGIGYTGGSLILFACLMAVLASWYWSQGSISVETVNTPKVEAFYWAAITFSQTLGTALGDWMPIPALGTKAGRSCSQPDWRSPLRCTIGRMCRASCYSGPRSFSLDRLALHWVTSSTSH